MLTELNRDKAGPGRFGPPTYGLRVRLASGSTSDRFVQRLLHDNEISK